MIRLLLLHLPAIEPLGTTAPSGLHQPYLQETRLAFLNLYTREAPRSDFEVSGNSSIIITSTPGIVV